MSQKLNILLFTLISQLAIGQNTILWKVTDTINDKTSHIVGTYHQFGNSFVDSLPKIKDVLLKSELAVFESIDNYDEIIEQRNSSNVIEKEIKKKDLKRLKQIAKGWKVDLYKLKPIEIALKLNQETIKSKCNTTIKEDKFDHFDKYLIQLAKKNKVEVMGLETFEVQLKSLVEQFNNYDWKKLRQEIGKGISQYENNDEFNNLCKVANEYRKFDLNYELDKTCQPSVLITERNANWMQVIPELIQKKNTFIAVGYFHLKWECGILEQLKKLGFKVEPIKIKLAANNGYK